MDMLNLMLGSNLAESGKKDV